MPTRVPDNLTGWTFGRWGVVGPAQAVSGRAAWNCICVCKRTGRVPAQSLKRGVSAWCGCLRTERQAEGRARAKANAPQRAAARRLFGLPSHGDAELPASLHASKPRPEWRDADRASQDLAQCFGYRA